MKKILTTTVRGTSLVFCLLIFALTSGGCDSLRFAPSEQQKQNAWLHNRTAIVAAETAKTEGTSEKLQSITELSELQSRAFTSYFGMPNEFPAADTVEQILAEPSREITQTAISQSANRPDPWVVADSMLELGIGVCALLGGVYGTKAVGVLKQTRAKTKALQEIITGNELFKKNNTEAATAFKDAHRSQSPETRQIVAAIK